jgi:predicted Mrr-cat superfamily restriction endonuclease
MVKLYVKSWSTRAYYEWSTPRSLCVLILSASIEAQQMTEKQAFVLKISYEIDAFPEALQNNQLIIGWAYAEGLLEPTIGWEQFREIIRTAYYSEEPNLRRAGAAGGHMWRFIQEMKVGDLVVVPRWSDFYIAEVTGPAFYDASKKDGDTAYRRPVIWLNNKNPIPRSLAKSALISRMKTYGTCAYATDLLDEILECLHVAKSGATPSFESDLQSRLVRETLDELRSGRMESYGFERLIETMLRGLGGKDTRIVPRNKDKGVDIVATFRVAGVFTQVVAVQAKHWQPDPPVGKDVVEELIRGVEAEEASLGMVITSGAIGEDAVERAKRYTDEKGIPIELVDGEQFAKLIVEHGIRSA